MFRIRVLIILLIIITITGTLTCLPAIADKCNNLIVNDRVNEALVCYESANDSAEKFLNLGTIYTLKEQYQKALEYFEKAYRLKPNNPAMQYAYGVGLINASKTDNVINLAHQNFKQDNDYVKTGNVQNITVYSKAANRDTAGLIVNYNY
ncbi:MAG: tetratricopeptide repeat protein [Cyanobacteriota bacterium]